MSDSSSKLQLRRETDRSPALRQFGWYHSFDFPDGSSIRGVITTEQLRERWAKFPIPGDLRGKRVLDIGAWDGWFSFEAERRGASVVSLDVVEIPNLLVAKERFQSQVDYRVSDLYKLPSMQLGTFDFVFFLGVLYHVKHPLLALHIVCALTLDVAIVESAIIDGPAFEAGVREEIPTLEFFETDELGGHLDNWFGPSVSCLMAMCRAVGFARVELLRVTATTACVACFRRWPDASETNREAAPELVSVINNANFGVNVSSDADDYLSWWFKCDRDLTRHDLMFEVGSFGCHAVSLTRQDGNTWAANTIVPPGLPKGWAQARMRTVDSSYSDPLSLAVDIPLEAPTRLFIDSVYDAVTWQTAVSTGASHAVLYVGGLGEAADRANVAAYWQNTRLLVDYVSEPDNRNLRQINIQLPPDLPASAEGEIVVRYGCVKSNPIAVKRA